MNFSMVGVKTFGCLPNQGTLSPEEEKIKQQKK
jgi:hypothetical protein